MSSFKHILVPTDFGPAAQQALAHAIELAKVIGAELTVMHTYELPVHAYGDMVAYSTAVLEAVEAGARQTLDATMADVRKQAPLAKTILHCGVPLDDILSVISTQKVDLVVMGTHGHRGIRHALLGSVAEKVVRLSPVPVLTAHAPKS